MYVIAVGLLFTVGFVFIVIVLFVCSEIVMVEPELTNIKKIGHDLNQAIPNGLTDIFVTTKKRWCMQHFQDRDSYKLKQFGANKRTVEQGHKNEIKNRQKCNEHLLSKETNEVVTSYSEFVERTIRGEHGATAQYWMGYIQMVHLHHEFIRSIRLGDLELYIFSISKITNYFLSFNHPNYARWMVM